MGKILAKRFPREIKRNIIRYLILLVLIIMGMYIVVSVVGASYNVIKGTENYREQNHIEDGEFTVFYPLTDAQMEVFAEEEILVEEKFSFDITMDHGKVLRFMKIRSDINLIALDEGRMPQRDGEIVLDKLFAQKNNILPGDNLVIQEETFEVVGIGSVPDYDLPLKNISDMTQDAEMFGCVFVTTESYERLLSDDNITRSTEDYTYSYRNNSDMAAFEIKEMIEGFTFDYEEVSDVYFQEMIEDALEEKKELTDGLEELDTGAKDLDGGIKDYAENIEGIALLLEANGQTELAWQLDSSTEKLLEGADELQSGTGELKAELGNVLDEIYELDLNNLTGFLEDKDNPRIASGAASDVEKKFFVGLAAGVIIMILFTYVISVFVVHQIHTETSVIGALYALGVKKSHLIVHYLMIPCIITLLGGIIGCIIGFSDIGVAYQMQASYMYYSIPEMPYCYPAFLIIYCVLMPPIIAIIINYIVIHKKLSATPLSLIKNEGEKQNFKSINIKSVKFIKMFQLRQMLREIRATTAVVLGMFISMVIFMIGINSFVLCKHVEEQNIADTKYEYMYMLKYPEGKTPEGGEACYVENLSKEYLGYCLDVSVIGIDHNNPYYDLKPIKGENQVIISTAVAQKYGLAEGDVLVLEDRENNRNYAFNIAGSVDYSVGLTVFMDIDSMRELFEKEEDYYNVILSNKALNIEDERIYTTTTKAQIVNAAGIFSEQMNSLIMILCGVSVIIFIAVMYLMMNVMVERSAYGISLVKIFGFRMKEIRKLYLSGNFYIIGIGAIFSILLAKIFADKIHPAFIANTAMGMDLSFSWQLYLAIYIGTLLIYWFVETVLVSKLKRIIPAEVLKNRE